MTTLPAVSRETAEAWAQEAGATSYSPPPLRAVRGVSLTFEQLEALVNRSYAEGLRTAVDICERRFMGDLNREDMEARRCADDIKTHLAAVGGES